MELIILSAIAFFEFIIIIVLIWYTKAITKDLEMSEAISRKRWQENEKLNYELKTK